MKKRAGGERIGSDGKVKRPPVQVAFAMRRPRWLRAWSSGLA